MKATAFEDHYTLSNPEKRAASILRLPIGVTSDGILEETTITDHHRQHILISGGSGSGKSNYLHAVLGSLLLNYTAEQVNIWLFDGGMCEFNSYANPAPSHIKRICASIDPAQCAAFIDDLEAEIRKRIAYLSAAKTTSFYACCQKTKAQPFPRLVVIMDGFDAFARTIADIDSLYAHKMEHILTYASTCAITFVASTQDVQFLSRYTRRRFLDAFNIQIATTRAPGTVSLLSAHPADAPAADLQFGQALVNTPRAHVVDLLYLSADIERQILS